MQKLVALRLHVGIANEEDCQKAFGIEADVDVGSGSPSSKTSIARLPTRSWRNFQIWIGRSSHFVKVIARIAMAGGAVLRTRESMLTSRHYDITDIIDRVGAGDSFSAGLIYGLRAYRDDQKALEFATAASVSQTPRFWVTSTGASASPTSRR